MDAVLLATVDGDAVREWLTAAGTVGAAVFAAWAAITSGGSARAAERAAEAAEKEAEVSRAQVETAREQIEVAREEAGVARRALRAQTQPVLIDEPLNLAVEERYDFPDGAMTLHPGGVVVAENRFSLPVRNMGRGPAHITGVGVRLTSAEGERVVGPSCNEITRSILPVGESARLNFWFNEETLGPRWDALQHTIRAYRNLSFLVRYSDLAENPDFISHFVVRRREGSTYGWEVGQVRVQSAAEVVAEEREHAERQRENQTAQGSNVPDRVVGG
jgi:hypothetical protein